MSKHSVDVGPEASGGRNGAYGGDPDGAAEYYRKWPRDTVTLTTPRRDGRAPIWGYARALGKALIKIAPEDFKLQWTDTGIEVSCTMRTEQEAEAVCEIIMTLARRSLTRHREAVRGDIYPPEPKPSFQEQLKEALGPLSSASGRLPQGEEASGESL